MTDQKLEDFNKLKLLISKDIVFLLPNNRFNKIQQIYIYSRCGLSLKYFDTAYENKKVLLQFGDFGPRVGYPVLWRGALDDYETGSMETKGNNDSDISSLTQKYLKQKLQE